MDRDYPSEVSLKADRLGLLTACGWSARLCLGNERSPLGGCTYHAWLAGNPRLLGLHVTNHQARRRLCERRNV
jgi:hypothetical protein